MVGLISIEDIDLAFDVVGGVKSFRSRFFSNLNKTINSIRLQLSRAELGEHLEIFNVFDDDFGRPVENGLVLLVDILERQNGRRRLEFGFVGQVKTEEFIGKRDFSVIGGVNVDVVRVPEASLDDTLISRKQIDEFEFLLAGGLFQSLSDGGSQHSEFFSFASHSAVNRLHIHVWQAHLDAVAAVEMENLQFSSMLVPMNDGRSLKRGVEDVVGIQVGESPAGEDPGASG